MRSIPALLVTVALLLAGCGDDDADVDAGGIPPSEVPGRVPDLVGVITLVTPFVPVTEDCVPAEDVDPEQSVSDEDPPLCTPDDNEVVGTILVEERPGVQEGRKISYTVTTVSTLEGVGGFDALAEGQTADTWVAEGMCAESYPEQCGLEAIRVTG